MEQITVKKFLLKKFPTNKYMDCPVPKHHWEVMQEYAEAYHESIQKERDKQIAAKAFTAGLDWRNGIIQHGAVHNPFPDKEEYITNQIK